MASIFGPSEEKTNGTKLARLLVDGGTQALRNVLESFIHPPSTLQIMLNNNMATLTNLKSRRKLYDSQWEKLFPLSGGLSDLNTFDITLLHLLLREICPTLIEPATGWHDMPAETDHSREAEIVRIKCLRNSLCHSISTGVPNDEFEDKWNTISHSLVALGLDQLEINRLKAEDIDHGTQRRIDEEVRKWKLEFEPRMKNLEQDLKQLKLDISSNQQHISAPRVTRELLNCLPDEIHHVFGRSEEIKRAIEAIQSGTVSIVSLTGGPGFGKTTVANKVAHELTKAEYNRKVLYCSLLSQASLKDIATTMFLICSNSHSQPPENPKLWLLNWSKQQYEKVTLILDNADHVLESGDRQEFVNMLQDLRTYSRQSLTFIITSRKTVNASSCGFKIENIRLTSLSLDEAEKVLLSRTDHVKQKLSQTTKIVELCGCIPLALCIVGSLLSEFKEVRLIKSLEKKPLVVLQDDEISVENAIKTSFDLLTPTEQKALAVMSVFPGSFDFDAAEAVITTGMDTDADPIVILRSLRNRSLLEQPSSNRYQIHQLIQAFAKRVGQASFSETILHVEQLACTYFICRLAENANLYWSKDKCKESVLNFNEDRHNFEHFLEVYVDIIDKLDTISDSPQVPSDKFLENFPQKCMYLEMCLLPSFYVAFLEKLLKYFETEFVPLHIVELLCLLGHEKRKIGNQEQYQNLMERAKEVYIRTCSAFKECGLSQVLFFNSYARFLRTKPQHLPREWTSQPISVVYGIAMNLCRKKLDKHPETAATSLFYGWHQKSIELLQEAMDLFQDCLGNHFMTAQCHKYIADLYFRCYFPDENPAGIEKCFEHYGAALTMMENLGVGDHKESILTLRKFALCHQRKGNYEEAINILTKAKGIAETELEEDHKWKVMIESQLALLNECIGNVEEAKEIMRKGLDMNERLNQPIDQLSNKREISEFLDRHPELSRVRMRPSSRK